MTNHKSGYSILKDKIAKLKTECDELDAKLCRTEEALEIAEKERDEWKEKYELLWIKDTNFVQRIVFLLDHCPFWVCWMYKKHFGN